MISNNSAAQTTAAPVQTPIQPTDVMTGDRNKSRYLYYQLAQSMVKAERIDIIVSFLMESGVRMLLKDLKQALAHGAKIRLLTGNYLGITQPSALYLIKHELGNSIDLRFYNEKERSFHPKSYIFHYKNHSELFIGSSNISRSALTSGIEWNYRFFSHSDPESFRAFCDTFEDLFSNHSIRIDDAVLREYSKNWHRPAAAKDLERYDESEEGERFHVVPLFEPRGAQIEALCALENTRAEGASKALITAATGIGKTALAAFDSIGYERVLFVSHREEILRQAARTFENIRESDDYGFFDGKEKCVDQPVVFASVQTLGSPQYLNGSYFEKDAFQYLIIDEIHHGVTERYRNILDYFEPQFLLGLTATPERMDGRSIYEICDYNVPYEISLREAINKGMLSPFRYYGIYDDTDYSALHIVKGHYQEEALTDTYLKNTKRSELILKHYRKHGSKRALGFCCSRRHAEYMASAFSKNGIPSVAVYSNAAGDFSEERAPAIRKLESGEIRVIFSVDMFNEGVDIPSVDMVMFLRPTESPVVFLQQLGRGLRREKGKEYLTVLDFIGNYEKAGQIRFLLSGETSASQKGRDAAERFDVPDDCLIDFDMQLIDLFRAMEQKKEVLRDRIRKEYFRIKEFLGRRPSRMDLFTYMDADVYDSAISHTKENPFRNYLDYLNSLNELSEDEQHLYNSPGKEFLHVIETTNMTKVYKMPVLMTFYNGGKVRSSVTEEELLSAWKRFFQSGTNWKDLEKDITYKDFWEIPDRAHLKKILTMPVHFLQESGKGFFVWQEDAALALRKELQDVIHDASFVDHFGDIINYRAMDYYKRRYQAGLCPSPASEGR